MISASASASVPVPPITVAVHVLAQPTVRSRISDSRISKYQYKMHVRLDALAVGGPALRLGMPHFTIARTFVIITGKATASNRSLKLAAHSFHQPPALLYLLASLLS